MAKAVRRDLRRTVGVTALATIGEAQTNIESLANSVAAAHDRLNQADPKIGDLGRGLAQLNDWARGQDTCYAADLTWLQNFRRFTTWQRLRWIVSGR